MSELGQIFKELNIPEETVLELVQLLKENPLAAMAKVTELDLPQESTQKNDGNCDD